MAMAGKPTSARLSAVIGPSTSIRYGCSSARGLRKTPRCFSPRDWAFMSAKGGKWYRPSTTTSRLSRSCPGKTTAGAPAHFGVPPPGVAMPDTRVCGDVQADTAPGKVCGTRAAGERHAGCIPRLCVLDQLFLSRCLLFSLCCYDGSFKSHDTPHLVLWHPVFPELAAAFTVMAVPTPGPIIHVELQDIAGFLRTRTVGEGTGIPRPFLRRHRRAGGQF